jgi:hypothetical protein
VDAAGVGEPRKRGNRVALGIGAGAAVLAVCAGGGWIVLSGSGSAAESSAGSDTTVSSTTAPIPRDPQADEASVRSVIASYVQAEVDGDDAQMASLECAEPQRAERETEDGKIRTEVVELQEIPGVTLNGDVAKARVLLKTVNYYTDDEAAWENEASQAGIVTLIYEDSAWKVCKDETS